MNIFSFYISLATIFVTRASIFFLESFSVNKYAYVGQFRWHHLYTGVVLVLLSYLLPKKLVVSGSVVLGVGLGFILDEPNVLLADLKIVNLGYWDWWNLCLVLFLTLFGIIFIKRK